MLWFTTVVKYVSTAMYVSSHNQTTTLTNVTVEMENADEGLYLHSNEMQLFLATVDRKNLWLELLQ